MLIDQLERLLDDTRALEPWQLTGPEIREVLVASQQAIAGLQSLVARLAGAAEDRALPREDGSATTTAWLAATTGIGRSEASKIVKLSRIDSGAATQERWSSGALSTEKASIILTALDRLPEWFDPEQVQDAEATLLGFADEFAAHDLRRLANRVVEVVDPDSADEIIGAQLQTQEKQTWDETHLTFTPRGDGLTWVRGALPDAQADMLRTVLEGLSAPRRLDALFRDVDGEHSDTEIGRLDHPRRMGQAFCELIEHLPTDCFPQAGGLAATVTVNIDLDDLTDKVSRATLSTGCDLSASQARRLACSAGILPVVLGGDSAPLDVGRQNRLHDRSQRIALAKRDGGCSWKGCDRPPGRGTAQEAHSGAACEAHHLTPWSEGGGTSVDNGALFCFTHHRLLHDSDWSARLAEDGVVEVIPPPRIDPRRRPLRHARHLRLRPLVPA